MNHYFITNKNKKQGKLFLRKEKKVIEKKKSKYDELFISKHSQADGFITIHKIKDKVYFEAPLSLLQGDMLLGSTITGISDNSNAIIGSQPTTPIHFCFNKGFHPLFTT